ncbi:mechanosensitive ion channel family protein [Sphingomonas baiyangensis]|uniref:Mechanosensitive ion channel n=1 Tax=Sphingomonas baiyangensis TaxID=2572576 RepID=A0A4U1L891_9SPHN|nr:mechanosensitive ion channel domain-containing protein [Sphingomonas baiyangensis]TKD53177.1 mechanosensitive ion channel [Sphingomonas baiyangensis]
MIGPVTGWLAVNGFAVPSQGELIEAAVAGALTLAALAIGWFASRRFGPRLADLLGRRAGLKDGPLQARICEILRHASAALLLALLFSSWPWRPYATLPIGLAGSAAAAMTAVAVLRGANVARWLAWGIAAFVFVSLFSYAVGGFTPVTTVLDRIGVDIGDTRVSLLSVVTIVIASVVIYAVARLANRVINHAIGNARGFDATQKLLFQKLAGIGVIVVAFFIGVDMLGIDLTTFAVFGGAFGLAIGFGMQKTIGNLIAGIILLFDRSIKPGDVIVVGDSFGRVNKIGVRAVSVITRDGKEHLIPNENLMTNEVENWSFSDRNVRIRIPVGVAYSTDLDLAQELMMRATVESPRVLASPEPKVWLTGFGDSSVDFEIRAWINDPESGVGNMQSDVLMRIWKLFKEHEIEIPFPQREVTIKAWPEAAADRPA